MLVGSKGSRTGPLEMTSSESLMAEMRDWKLDHSEARSLRLLLASLAEVLAAAPVAMAARARVLRKCIFGVDKDRLGSAVMARSVGV